MGFRQMRTREKESRRARTLQAEKRDAACSYCTSRTRYLSDVVAQVGIAARTKHRVGHNEPMSAKYTIDHMRLVAAARGGDCLSTEYGGNKVSLVWQCTKGHTWHAKPNAVMSRRHWCPHCAQKFPRSIHFMQVLASQHDGECLDSIAHGMQNDHRWRCKAGHEFSMKPNNVKYGHWCGQCWRDRR